MSVGRLEPRHPLKHMKALHRRAKLILVRMYVIASSIHCHKHTIFVSKSHCEVLLLVVGLRFHTLPSTDFFRHAWLGEWITDLRVEEIKAEPGPP